MDVDAFLREESIRNAAAKAHELFPRLTQYAPTVSITTMKERPDVAGYYDPDTKSVQVNRLRSKQLSTDQLAGLIALERTRGHLESKEGAAFINSFPLTMDQRAWWKKFYIDTAGDAPADAEGQDAAIKGTMISRLIVGDAFPSGAPPVTQGQLSLANQLRQYYRGQP